MYKKIFSFLLIFTLMLCGACSNEIIELMDDPYVLRVDLTGLINDSDTIVFASVEETLPAELKGSGDSKYVITPANIKVIQSLKGDYKPGDIFTINQFGGVAGGVDYRPNTMFFHKNGETYLFFIVNEYGEVLYSEHLVDGQMTGEGYFFDGKTTDEAVSIINELVKK